MPPIQPFSMGAMVCQLVDGCPVNIGASGVTWALQRWETPDATATAANRPAVINSLDLVLFIV